MKTDDLSSDSQKVYLLENDIKKWNQYRRSFMPKISSPDVDPLSEAVFDYKLSFPSSFTEKERIDLGLQDQAKVEYKLREGQAFDALSSVKDAIRSLEEINILKKRFTHGKSNMTSSSQRRNKAFQLKEYFRKDYSAARRSLLKLGMDANDFNIRRLTDEDLYRPVLSEGYELGSGKKKIGWIWSIGGDAIDLTQSPSTLEGNSKYLSAAYY